MATSKPRPLVFVALFIGAVALVVALLVIFRTGGYRSLEPFPTKTYSEQPTNLMGNEYTLTAQIHSMLGWEEGTGRLLAVRPDGSQTRLPVFVPDALGKSIHTGQRYRMRVLIDHGGVITVEDLDKY